MTRAGSMPTAACERDRRPRTRVDRGPHPAHRQLAQAPLLTFMLLAIWVLYALVAHGEPARVLRRAVPLPVAVLRRRASRASCPPEARDFGTWFGHFPPFIPLALLVLPFLLGFRLTCYYYRRAYYRAFWQSPPACAVAEPHAKYTGETSFPLIFQNLHRYFFAGGRG